MPVENKAPHGTFVGAAGQVTGRRCTELFKIRHWLLGLSDEGFDIQVHTHTHLNSVAQNEQLAKDTSICRTLIEDLTGKAAMDFCYPSGYWEKKSWRPLTNEK